MRTPPTETIAISRADETTTDGRRTVGTPSTVGTVRALVEPCAYDRPPPADAPSRTAATSTTAEACRSGSSPATCSPSGAGPCASPSRQRSGGAATPASARRSTPRKERTNEQHQIRPQPRERRTTAPAYKALLDNVQAQVERAAAGDPRITVYRNDDASHGNVVATAPVALK